MRDKPRFGVPHRRRRIAVHRAEVALPVDQRVAHGERLRHAHQRVVDRRRRRADGTCPSLRRRSWRTSAWGGCACSPISCMPIENAAMHRLQAVADVGQRAADDHAHRVVEIRPAHLVFDVDRDDVLIAASRRQRDLATIRRRGGNGWNVWIVGQRKLRGRACGSAREIRWLLFYFSKPEDVEGAKREIWGRPMKVEWAVPASGYGWRRLRRINPPMPSSPRPIRAAEAGSGEAVLPITSNALKVEPLNWFQTPSTF